MPATCLIPDRSGGREGADRDCGELRQLDLDFNFPWGGKDLTEANASEKSEDSQMPSPRTILSEDYYHLVTSQLLTQCVALGC